MFEEENLCQHSTDQITEVGRVLVKGGMCAAPHSLKSRENRT